MAYLKASGNKKTYSDYLWVVQEAEMEEVMEPSCNPPMATANKPWAMSFFPLQKLKGSQPAMTPSTWVAHLEEEGTNKEECIDSKDPNGIKGVTKEFIVHPARAVKDDQQEEEVLLPLQESGSLYLRLLVVASRKELHLNQKEGMAPKKRTKAPQAKVTPLKVPQDGTPKWSVMSWVVYHCDIAKTAGSPLDIYVNYILNRDELINCLAIELILTVLYEGNKYHLSI